MDADLSVTPINVDQEFFGSRKLAFRLSEANGRYFLASELPREPKKVGRCI